MNGLSNEQVRAEQVTAGSRHGLQLVKKAPQRSVVAEAMVLREGSTGAVVVMLPRVWAVAETEDPAAAQVRLKADVKTGSRPAVEMGFYRKYTEGLLRRYLRLSTEAGRVPSLLGRELFRGNVSHYRVHSFEDVVLFCMDVERCLAKLNLEEKDLVRRVALQEYTQAEAAAVLGMSALCVATVPGSDRPLDGDTSGGPGDGPPEKGSIGAPMENF